MIQVTELGKKFQQRWIFKNLSLHIAAQTSVALVGPSGCGKSTLLKVMARLLEPDWGTCHVHHSVGMLFQQNALFDSMTVADQFLFPLKASGTLQGAEAYAQMQNFLAQVGLAGYENHYPQQLSGGMQKRLGLARMLILEPQIMLCDEPTAGLDPITAESVLEWVQVLQKQHHRTLCVVTNDPRQIQWMKIDHLYEWTASGLEERDSAEVLLCR